MGELKEQSNPFSTGGGGVNFETRVQASFVVALLAGTPVPCLPTSARVKEIGFQNRYAGVHTDDLQIIAEDFSKKKYCLHIQIKHEITVSDSSESTFAEVVRAAWEDFKNPQFDGRTDAIVLISGPLTKVDVANTIPVLEWARYSSSADDFLKKSNTEGFTSAKKIERLNSIRTQLDRANGDLLSDHEFWSFLKVFHLISYDLDQSSSVTASLLGSLLRQHSELAPSTVLAQVVTTAQDFNQNAGILTVNNVPIDLINLFKSSVTQSLECDIKKLSERSHHIYFGISNAVRGIHIPREEAVQSVRNACEEGGFVFVTGERGAGKSGVVKDYVQSRSPDAGVFYVRTEDFDKNHLNDVFASMGIGSSLSQLASYFSLIKEKILVIESIEKVLELNNPAAFTDLLNFIRPQNGWCVIATGRDYAYQQLAFNYFQPCGLNFKSVKVPGFTVAQVENVCNYIPALKQLTGNAGTAGLLRNPFFIDLAARAVSNGAEFEPSNTEEEFRKIVWKSVIEKQSDRREGMPARRKSAFIAVAKLRAKRMVFGVPETDFDPAVIAKLEEDNLIHRDPRSSLLSPAHDVLEDWALGEFIESEYIASLGAPNVFLAAIGSEPAINRGFRLWLSFKLAAGAELTELIGKTLTSDDVAGYWKDEVIATILQSSDPAAFLELMKRSLLSERASLLIRFYFIIRIACQRPMEGWSGFQANDSRNDTSFLLFLRPHGKGWEALINFTFENRMLLGEEVFPHVVELIHTWSGIITIWNEPPAESAMVGNICLFLLEKIESYGREKLQSKVLQVLLKIVSAIPEEFNVLVERDVFASKRRSDRPSYVDEFVRLALVGEAVAILCRHRPDFIIRLARHEWLQPEEADDDGAHYRFRSGIGLGESYGLEDEHDYFPASGSRGPFKYLLKYHPRQGLDFVLDICCVCAAKHAASEYGQQQVEQVLGFLDEMIVEKVLIHSNDGIKISHFASPHLWKGYRGHSTVPYVLQCALMALENWLVEYVESPPSKNELPWIYDYVLKNSNSVLTTAVLASVAVGFPEQVGSSAYPLLRCAGLYKLDLRRGVEERAGEEINWFATQRDQMSRLYEEERRVSALRPWRKETLEVLAAKLQFFEVHRIEVYKIIDELSELAETSDDKSLKFMIHRINTRAWEAVADEENKRIVYQSAGILSDDLHQIQVEHQDKHAHDFTVTRLYAWSRKIFEAPTIDKRGMIEFDEAIADARRILDLFLEGNVGNFQVMALGAVATTAAVAVRDYFEVLSVEEFNWCLELILQIIFLNSDDRSGHMAIDATDASGAAACAYVLPKLLEFDLDAEQLAELHYAIVTSITHANIHVCGAAAKGVRDYLWSRDEDLANRCFGGALEFARLELESSNGSLRALRNDNPDTLSTQWSTIVSEFRENLLEAEVNFDPSGITPQTHSLWRVHIPMLMVPFGSYGDSRHCLLSRVVTIVYEDEKEQRQSNRSCRLNHDVKKVIQDCLAEHVIATKSDNFKPVLDLLLAGCKKAPTFIYLIKLRFDSVMEQQSDYDGMWELWNLLEPQLYEIAIDDVNTNYSGRRYNRNTFLRGMLYGDGEYPDHPARIRAIEAGERHLLNFFARSAQNSLVFEALCSLMYHFHALFFDKGIHILASEYRKNPCILGLQGNTAFCLEMSIAKYLQLSDKLSVKMYEACLDLLTGIVETGSARAYYLRESLIRTRRIAV